ncbi:MAG: hypothetical protein JWN97_3999, partial [Nocardioides sp.]|nr:hypothetical protein [Nocardioides sp.]
IIGHDAKATFGTCRFSRCNNLQICVH